MGFDDNLQSMWLFGSFVERFVDHIPILITPLLEVERLLFKASELYDIIRSDQELDKIKPFEYSFSPD